MLFIEDLNGVVALTFNGFLRLTVNLFPLRLTDVLKLISIVLKSFVGLSPFWNKKVDFVNYYNKLCLPFLYCRRKIYINKITDFKITI